MNCETFHEFLVERIYGRLPSDREAALQQHARECADCAVALQRTLEVQNVFDPGEEILEPRCRSGPGVDLSQGHFPQRYNNKKNERCGRIAFLHKEWRERWDLLA